MTDKNTCNPEYILCDVFTELYNVLHIFYATDIYFEKQFITVTCFCELLRTHLMVEIVLAAVMSLYLNLV
jgi:hypothetical protein